MSDLCEDSSAYSGYNTVYQLVADIISSDKCGDGQENPEIVILEQPMQQGFRFRYKSETGSHGGLQGAFSAKSNKTFPKIRVDKCTSGAVLITAKLYTNEPQPRPHVHQLLGNKCENGIWQCTVGPSEQWTACLANVGILHAAKKEIFLKLQERIHKEMKDRKSLMSASPTPANEITLTDVEERQAELKAEEQTKEFSSLLNAVRLGFSAEIVQTGQRSQTVFSSPIFDCKSPSTCKLKICRIDHHSGSCHGDQEIFLLCDKVQKENIKVKFYEENERNEVVWSADGKFGPHDVHKQYAIVFKTPAYQNESIEKDVKVWIKLERTNDGAISNSVPFTYMPREDDYDQVAKKRKKKIPGMSGEDFSCNFQTEHFMPLNVQGYNFTANTCIPNINFQTSALSSNALVMDNVSSIQDYSEGLLIPRDADAPTQIQNEISNISNNDFCNDINVYLNSANYTLSPNDSASSESCDGKKNNNLDLDQSMLFDPSYDSEWTNLFEEVQVSSTQTMDESNDFADSANLLEAKPFVIQHESYRTPISDESSNNLSQAKKYTFSRSKLPYVPLDMVHFKNSLEELMSKLVNEFKIEGSLPRITEITSHFLNSVKNILRPEKLAEKSQIDSREYKNITSNIVSRKPDIIPSETVHKESQMKKKDVHVCHSGIVSPGDKVYEKIAQQNIALLHKNIKDEYLQQSNTSRKKIITNHSIKDGNIALRIAERTAEALSNFAITGKLSSLLIVMRHLTAIQDEAGDNVLCQAIIHNNVKVVKAILKILNSIPKNNIINQCNNLKQNALHLAVLTHQPEVVQLLINFEADVLMTDNHGNNPIHLASHLGDSNSLNILLNKSNYRDSKHPPNLDILNYDGFAALHLAVQANNLACVKALTFNGACINVQDGTSGRTPLHHAVELKNSEIISHMVVELKADVNAQMYNCNTPLHIAFGRGYDSVVFALLASGADPMIENLEPLDSSSEDDSSDALKASKNNNDFPKPCHTAYHLATSKTLSTIFYGKRDYSKILISKEKDLIKLKKDFEPIGFVSGLDISGGDLNKVPYSARLQLSDLLDPISPDGNDWKFLAKILEFDMLVPKLLVSKHSPTRTILDSYEACEGTIEGLKKAFIQMDRQDALKVLNYYIPSELSRSQSCSLNNNKEGRIASSESTNKLEFMLSNMNI